MGIISLKEKRTSDLFTHTTGRERSYFTSDQFPTTFAKITGKIFSWGTSNASVYGGFGAFWEETDGTLVDLEMEIDNASGVNEQGSRLNSSASDAWLDLEISLTSVSNGRLIFYARKMSATGHFQMDVDLDDITLVCANGTSVDFDPSTTAVRTGTKWQRSSTGQDSGPQTMSSYATAKTAYGSANFSNMGNETGNDWVSWNYVSEDGGTSNDTGSDNAADNNDNTIYLYWEATSQDAGLGKGSFLRWKNSYNITTGAEL